MDLTIEIYRVMGSFPASEMYGITQQIKRAAVSIPSNIAEGAARQTHKELVNFLHIAQASLSELDTQIELAKRLGYIEGDTWSILDAQMVRIDKMITGLIRHQKSSHPSRPHALRLTRMM